MSDLAYLSAAEALEAFRARTLSPVELTEEVIARAEATEPQINALTYRYFEEALSEARQAEARFMGRGPDPRPLEGLCVAVKDSGHIQGLPTSAGSLLSDEAPQRATSPLNQRVLDAGAIVHARSATPEYSCAAVTWSRRWGVTRNPWNLAMTPGGSSGGAGAALAAGSATLATGSDIGGSVRIPAACSGVVGYKPPRGRNPVDPPFNLDPYCHTGPMARTVVDALLFQNVLSGPHPEDPNTLPRHAVAISDASAMGLRIALSPDLGFCPVEPEIVRALEDAARMLRDRGATVEAIDIPWGEEVLDAALTHLRLIFGTSIAPKAVADWNRMTPYARAFAEQGLAVTPRDYLTALGVAGEAGRILGQAMASFDLLLCPTTALPAVPADFDPAADALSVAGRSVNSMLGWTLTVPFNMLSSHPVMSVPVALADCGVPIGVQLVGRPYDDDTVFCAALALEAARGRWFGSVGLAPALRAAEVGEARNQ